nr:(2Fe-2S)-binding protein [uncultured Rhodopila sp.]
MCVCNALTDRMLLQAASLIGSTRPSRVYAACGCRLQCGTCVPAVARLLQRQAAETREPSMAAE